MSTTTPSATDSPRPSALKSEGDGDKPPLTRAQSKSVQISEPLPVTPEEASHKKRFPASLGSRRLSGRPPLMSNPSRTSVLSLNSLDNLDDIVSKAVAPGLEPEDSTATQASHHHRINHVSKKFLGQVAEWVQYEKTRLEEKKAKRVSSRQKSLSTTTSATPDIGTRAGGHIRTPSEDSEYGEAGLDRLQQILNDSMAALGIKSLPSFSPRLGKGHRKRSHRSLNLARTLSSDGELAGDDPLVPSCDAVLDNTLVMTYLENREKAPDRSSISYKKGDKDRQAWLAFKSEIIRLAHTLRLKSWRRVPLDDPESISVERLSGALTNAVYVVSPREGAVPTGEGKSLPNKVLLRIYGPQVDIDRENELMVLRRLARKKIGPRLLGTFSNGRFEQFFNAATLTPSNLRDPETSKQIAKRMRELHDGIELLDEERSEGPEVWNNWNRWVEQAGTRATALDKQIARDKQHTNRNPGEAWKSRGYVCGVEWPVFKATVEKYRKYLDTVYGDSHKIRERLVFAHNDAQYGNILRLLPDDEKSPLLQPANEHKQLIVIDFEYAGANVPGLDLANHFSEWTYNYHDSVAPYSCNTANYPTPEEQYRFIKSYVGHRPQFPHAGSTPTLTPLTTPGGTPYLHGGSSSTSSIVDFMLDARVAPQGGWREDDIRRDEDVDRRVRELMEETRLWRVANSAHWVAWGIVQARIPGLTDDDDKKNLEEKEEGFRGSQEHVQQEIVESLPEEEKEEVEADEFDYLGYAQERALFFWGDCVLLGLVKKEDLPGDVRERIKLVHY